MLMKHSHAAVRSTLPLLAILTALVISTNVFAAPPTLTHIFPAGGQRGTKVTVICKSGPTWPLAVNAPGVTVVPGTDAGKLEIEIPADLPADRIWIRLHNAEGATPALPFLIGNLKEIEEVEPNDTHRAPQVLPGSELTINGVLKGADVDGFAVELAAGQTLVASLDANERIGSPVDAILQVASPEGVVLAENHDDVGLDPRLAFTAKKAGRHIVRVFGFSSTPNTTIALQGGENFIYRLTVTTGAFVTHTIPMAVLATGEQFDPASVDAYGWNVPAGTKLNVVPFGGASLAELLEIEPQAEVRNPFDVRLGFAFNPAMAGAARVRVVSHPVLPTVAKPDPANPPLLMPPVAATGWMQTPRQDDVFRLQLTQGQQYVIAVESRSLDFPLETVLSLLEPTGKTVVAENDSPGSAAPTLLTHAATQTGEYILKIRDRNRRAGKGADGQRCFYRLTVRAEEPDFELLGAADNVVVAPDKPTEFVVNVVRRAAPGGAIGPIVIQAVDLPPGVVAPPVTSEPTGATAAKVTLSFTTTGPAFSGRIKIVGTTSQPKELRRLVRTPASFGACFETFWLTAVAKP